MTSLAAGKAGAPALEELSREQLLTLLEELDEGGIHIQFSGKANARGLARRVRPRVLKPMRKYSCGSELEQAHNLLIEGDNLQAMATLYRQRGQVDLILTDPPYNTGNDWRYNDRWEDDPNDPGLGEWVTPDDRARHTKWMRFMWPRLQMMRSMLKPSGVLAICIDHRELFHLGQMLDELFGSKNRLAIINWQKSTAPRNDATHVSTATEYVLVYAKDSGSAETGTLPRTESANSRYRDHDDDPRGRWREHDLSARTPSEAADYAIQSPFTGALYYPPGKYAWRYPKQKIRKWLEEWGSGYVEKAIDDGRSPALLVKGAKPDKLPVARQKAARRRLAEKQWPFIWFGLDGTGGPRVKRYLEDMKKGMVPTTYWAGDNVDEQIELGSTSWDFEESGLSQSGIKELGAVVGKDHGFETVKPLKLFSKLIQLWCPADGLTLDPFAGSGTTGHAVLHLNAVAATNRRFILIEQGRPEKNDSYARSLTANRLKRVVSGKWAIGRQEGIGGGFRVARLDQKIDAEALLKMEREELADTLIASHFDRSSQRRDSLIEMSGDTEHRYLVARTEQGAGVFLVWSGVSGSSDLDEETYEACVAEAAMVGLKPPYHVYARLNSYQVNTVDFHPIPDQILMDFGLSLSGEPYFASD
ncbi:MAG TPA: site-specific DNA-methyltransferase [Solirubrobacterales bacterium]|nr:site-specific DNA-methyltransferase [Solirubrobacterales bacterium]